MSNFNEVSRWIFGGEHIIRVGSSSFSSHPSNTQEVLLLLHLSLVEMRMGVCRVLIVIGLLEKQASFLVDNST